MTQLAMRLAPKKRYRCACRKHDIADGDTVCMACRRRFRVIDANFKLRDRVRWCVSCTMRRAEPDGLAARRLLAHHFDAGAAIASLAGYGDGDSGPFVAARIQLWRVVLGDPLWSRDDEWDGTLGPKRSPHTPERALLRMLKAIADASLCPWMREKQIWGVVCNVRGSQCTRCFAITAIERKLGFIP